jgi:hypothetical protein
MLRRDGDDAGELDAAAQISVFAKLKLTDCARPDHRGGRLILSPCTNAAPRLFLACHSQPTARRRIDSKRESPSVGASAYKFSCI